MRDRLRRLWRFLVEEGYIPLFWPEWEVDDDQDDG